MEFSWGKQCETQIFSVFPSSSVYVSESTPESTFNICYRKTIYDWRFVFWFMICLHRKRLRYASSACDPAGVDVYDRTLALAAVACLS